MRWTQLRHASPNARERACAGTPLPHESALDALITGAEVVFSFRKPRGAHDRVKFTASTPLACPALTAQPRNVVCLFWSSDCAHADVLFWDLFHSLPVGATVVVVEDLAGHTLFSRDYFRDCAQVEQQPSGSAYRSWKVTKTGAGCASGFSQPRGWTFGIPTGPGDATILNACVSRILSLELPGEIVLCGRPGPTFRYLDRVRVIGEDIPFPPLRIATKKNRLAAEARFDNFCVLHDRVLLPRNFAEAMKHLGDAPPLAGMQTAYFVDRWNLVARRYSDYNAIRWKGGMRPRLEHAGGASHPLLDDFNSIAVPSIIETSRFQYQHPHRYDADAYLTGSLYICRTELWRRVQQNESLAWEELEDVEFGLRANRDHGVPCRLTTDGLALSMIARSAIAAPCDHVRRDGAVVTNVAATWAPLRLVLPVKPVHAKIFPDIAAGLREFVEKHVAPELRSVTVQRLNTTKNTLRQRITNLLIVLKSVRLPRDEASLQQFFNDVERWLLFESVPPHVRRRFVERLLDPATEQQWVLDFVTQTQAGAVLINGGRRLFARSLSEFTAPASGFQRFAAAVWLLTMTLFERTRFAFRGSWSQRWSVVRASLPHLEERP